MRFTSASTRQFWSGLISATALSMVACTSNGASAPDPAPQLAGTQWVAQSIGGQALGEGKLPTLAFSPTLEVSGHGGCNEFSGQATAKGQSLTFGPLLSTKMSCGPARDKLEASFLGALRNARQVGVKGDLLKITGSEAGTEVVLRRQ